mgnify:CR=1 FL=1
MCVLWYLVKTVETEMQVPSPAVSDAVIDRCHRQNLKEACAVFIQIEKPSKR